MAAPNDLLRLRKFWIRVQPVGECWEWTGARIRAGYGIMYVRWRVVYVHRFVYELFNGPIPVGLEIDHLCRNKNCVNPAHLEAVSHRLNSARAAANNHNAIKTHCARGHAYTPENTYRYHNRRNCRTCTRALSRAGKRRRREERRAA